MNLGIFKLKKLIFVLIVILVLAGVGVYYFLQYQKTQSLLKDPSKAAVVETQALIDKVGKLVLLPSEQPVTATVSNKEDLPKHPLFVNAQNGDKVLIYKLAKRAILYRPSINKIVEMSSISVELEAEPQISPSQTEISTPSVSPTVKLSPTLSPTSIITPTP